MTAPAGVVHLVTGARGAGKTTFCRNLLGAVRDRHPGVAAAGVVSPRVVEGGEETAIDVVDVATGRRRRLAVRGGAPGGPEGPATPRWRFDAAALRWGDRVLGGATPCSLLIVDELGVLEFERGEGWPNGLAAVDSGAFAAAFVVVRPGLLTAAGGRWPGARPVLIDGPGGAGEAALRHAGEVAALLEGA